MLIIVTVFLFADSFKENMILFSNDGPLGSISTDAIEMPGTFFGYWHDLNWLGYEQPSASPGIYMALGLLLQKSVLYLKLCTPICLIILGMSAWFFFRTIGLRNLACTIGALAAAFNMEVVSHACWGLPSRSLTFATTFLAGAFILRAFKSRPWPNLALAGICVGLGLMEGYDVGALFSLYIAAFVLFGFVIKPLDTGKQTALGQALGQAEQSGSPWWPSPPDWPPRKPCPPLWEPSCRAPPADREIRRPPRNNSGISSRNGASPRWRRCESSCPAFTGTG